MLAHAFVWTKTIKIIVKWVKKYLITPNGKFGSNIDLRKVDFKKNILYETYKKECFVNRNKIVFSDNSDTKDK